MENVKCTLPNCEFCKDLNPDHVLDFFLQESNAIESIYDPDSLEQARNAWHYLINETTLDGGVILKTHKLLMKNQPIEPNQRGHWRTCQVWVGGREGLNWHGISEAIAGWLGAVKATEAFSKTKQYMGIEDHKEEIMAERIKTIHVMYERIHPFIDGNGRTGRMFLNWLRLKIGLPLLIIHSENKQDYYEWFKKAGERL